VALAPRDWGAIGKGIDILLDLFFEDFYSLDFLCGLDMCLPDVPAVKWYNPIDRHNYRKMHHVTPRRVVKRRDRQSRGRVSLLKIECGDEEDEE